MVVLGIFFGANHAVFGQSLPRVSTLTQDEIPSRSHVSSGDIVNDVHSKLNRTRVARIVTVNCVDDVIRTVNLARRTRQPVAIAGGKHAMGGQQFCRDGVLLDMNNFNRVIAFDPKHGTIEVESGIQWPDLIRRYHVIQGRSVPWGIRQKQTGADRLSIGGAVAANIHGRGLTMAPFSQDIVSLRAVLANGELVTCSRNERPELFSLLIGGYGLFGVVVSAVLQLVPRQVVQRVVERRAANGLMDAFTSRINDGYLYGDFQFATDPNSDAFLNDGVFSCYRPVANDRPIPKGQLRLSRENWARLLHLAHTDKSRAFDDFAEFYVASSGQLYWSDTHQLTIYLDDYHAELDLRLCADTNGSEMITETYVPKERLEEFLAAARADFRQHEVDLIYGTIRLIEPDRDSFLSWADRAYACVIFNLHTDHDEAGRVRTASAIRRIIDLGIACDGKYFLTYHRHATLAQLQHCYPQIAQFLNLKRRYDPFGVFQSDWYRHLRTQVNGHRDH